MASKTRLPSLECTGGMSKGFCFVRKETAKTPEDLLKGKSILCILACAFTVRTCTCISVQTRIHMRMYMHGHRHIPIAIAIAIAIPILAYTYTHICIYTETFANRYTYT